MKIIHVIHDDKFPPMAHKVFEAVYPGKNEFVIFTNKKELVHSKSIKPTVYKHRWVLFPLIIKKIIKADLVVFHSMSVDSLRILKALPKNIKTIWIGWGYDYYDLLPNNLLKEKTIKLDSKPKKEEKGLKQRINRILKQITAPELDKKYLINKINVFSPVLYEDYLLVKQALPDFEPAYGAWNYGTLEDDHIRGFEDKQVNGNNILLGNSAFATNNHLEAFELLQILDLKGRKVVTPLSYGDINYRDLIVHKGIEILGNNFKPLTDFMPIDDYIAVLQSCSVVVMNHLRQQALGNIVIALYMGAKVFLDERNPVYDFFIKQGAFVFELEQLQQEYTGLLTTEQVEHNREILRSYWSRDVILKKTQKLVEQALS